MINTWTGEASTPVPLAWPAAPGVAAPSSALASAPVCPEERRSAFDLAAFGRALKQCDVVYQLSCYAPDADIRIVDPEHSPSAPRLVRGVEALSSWLKACGGYDVDVTRLVAGGDRVAFAQSWCRSDGVLVMSTSTAELCDAVISTQHTIVEWASSRHVPPAAVSGWRSDTAMSGEVGGGFSTRRDEQQASNPSKELS